MTNPLVVISGLVILVAVIKALSNRYKDTRDMALKKGHSQESSQYRGIAYVVLACGACIGLIYSIFMTKVGFLGHLGLIVLILAVFTVGANWVFKKPRNDKDGE